MTDKTILIAKQINARLNPGEVLESLGIKPNNIREDNGTIKSFCPIHKDKSSYSLAIDKNMNTYICSNFFCQGSNGGDLLDLYSKATLKPMLEVINHWGHQTGYLTEEIKEPDKKTPQPVKSKDYLSIYEISSETDDVENILSNYTDHEIMISKINPTNENLYPYKEENFMETKEKSNSTNESVQEKLDMLKEREPDWYQQSRMQEAMSRAEVARMEAVTKAQIDILTEYWDKHRQNLKAYEKNIVSLDELHTLESKLIQNKRDRMNRSYAIGERAFKETYEKMVREICPSDNTEQKEENKEEALVTK